MLMLVVLLMVWRTTIGCCSCSWRSTRLVLLPLLLLHRRLGGRRLPPSIERPRSRRRRSHQHHGCPSAASCCMWAYVGVEESAITIKHLPCQLCPTTAHMHTTYTYRSKQRVNDATGDWPISISPQHRQSSGRLDGGTIRGCSSCRFGKQCGRRDGQSDRVVCMCVVRARRCSSAGASGPLGSLRPSLTMPRERVREGVDWRR